MQPRNPLEDQNFNFDKQYFTSQTQRNSNKPNLFPTERSQRTLSGKANQNPKQFDVMCFLMCVELERLSSQNEKLIMENQEIKEKSYEFKNYEYQVKDLSERLMRKELLCQKLENQLADVNKLMAQKEMLVQSQYQQISQQVNIVQQLQYQNKQLECKMGFLVCENENLNMKQTEQFGSQQKQNARLSQEQEELQKVYKSLLENYNLQNEKLTQLEIDKKELERINNDLTRKVQQQEQENKNTKIQYVDCKQKFILLTTEIDRVNDMFKKQQFDQEMKSKKFENKIQMLSMRIILHCSEIDRLIEVQGKLMTENQQYRNQIELYALMMQDQQRFTQRGASGEKHSKKPQLL